MFKNCPECGGEFQQWVERCPDCGVALVSAGAFAPPEPSRELPPASQLECVERGEPWSLRQLAGRLQQQGISCRIDAWPPDAAIRPPERRGAGMGAHFGLYVLGADLAAARRVHAEQLAAVVPGADALAGAAAATLAECPACGEPLAETAASCAACGLEFPEAGSEV
jgi:hypothetical protein